MIDNPFDPKLCGLLGALGLQTRRNSLLDNIGAPEPAANPLTRTIAGLGKSTLVTTANPFDAFGLDSAFAFGPEPEKPSNALAGILASARPSFPSPPPVAFGSLANIIARPLSPAQYVPPPKPQPIAPETKRKVFFSFQFDDIDAREQRTQCMENQPP